MRYYKQNGSGRVKAVLFKIFFVICAALLIVIVSALIGNHLRAKIEKLGADTQMSENETDNTVEYVNAGAEYHAPPSVNGAGIDIRNYSAKDEPVLAINSLDENTDTVLVKLNGEDGELLYSSAALTDEAKIPANDDNSEYEMILSTISAAKAKGMRVWGSFAPSFNIEKPENAAFIDSIKINELAAAGFDSIILKVPHSDSGTWDEIKWFITYLSELSTSGCDIGVSLCADFYLSTYCARQLPYIVGEGAFLCISFDGAVSSDDIGAESIRHDINSLVGIFTLYKPCVIIEDNTSAAAVYKACTSSGLNSLCFTGYKLPDEPQNGADNAESEPGTETTAEEDTEFKPEEHTNPYASHAPDSTDSDPAETDSVTPDTENDNTAETDAVSEEYTPEYTPEQDTEEAEKPWY